MNKLERVILRVYVLETRLENMLEDSASFNDVEVNIRLHSSLELLKQVKQKLYRYALEMDGDQLSLLNAMLPIVSELLNGIRDSLKSGTESYPSLDELFGDI